jgi:hypothetical protein
VGFRLTSATTGRAVEEAPSRKGSRGETARQRKETVVFDGRKRRGNDSLFLLWLTNGPRGTEAVQDHAKSGGGFISCACHTRVGRAGERLLLATSWAPRSWASGGGRAGAQLATRAKREGEARRAAAAVPPGLGSFGCFGQERREKHQAAVVSLLLQYGPG